MLRKLNIPIIVCGIVLLCLVSGRLFAQKPEGELKTQQKLVYLLQDGSSHLMLGEAPDGVNPQQLDQVLPQYLAQGWRIARIDMTGSAGVMPEQIIGIALLEK